MAFSARVRPSILLGVGGSACTDGGSGALDAIATAGGLGATTVTILCDVTTAFERAPAVFGPQKGADPTAIARLEARLDALADTFPRDPRGVTRTGAAGGLSGGMWSVYDAELVSGIDRILDLVGFDAQIQNADVVVTGEGRLDDQTAQGKVVAGITRRAGAAAVPVYAVVGSCGVAADRVGPLGLAGVLEAGTTASLRAAGRTLTEHIARRRRAQLPDPHLAP